MKLFFDRSDSFYKIFKTLEKIADGRTISIEIHPHNQFFKNMWRGKQLIELLKEKKINYTIQTNSDFVMSYFQEIGENAQKNTENSIKKWAHLVYNFFFNIKKFHLQMMNKKDYLSFVVLGLETLIVLIALYIFYIILIPTATIGIKPNYTIEEIAYNFRYYPVETPLAGQDNKFISIPYYKSSIEHDLNFAVPLSDLKYNILNAKWFVKFTNTLNTQITLKPNTKLITKDGLLFKATEWIIVPGNGSVTVPVEALEKDEKEEIIWTRWNILAGVSLEVKNLQGSLKSKVTAVASTNFSWGKFFTEWIISKNDIEWFKIKAQEQLHKIKRDVLIKQIKTESTKPLLFDDMIDIETISIAINKKEGDIANTVDGTIKSKISYRYIYRNELLSAVYKYTSQRPNQSFSLVEIDRWSAVLYDRFLSSTWVYIIPTKINTIWWYNFVNDVAWIKNQIKSKVRGLDEKNAQKAILTFPNIGATEITISPFWVSNIPNVMSRIKIEVIK